MANQRSDLGRRLRWASQLALTVLCWLLVLLGVLSLVARNVVSDQHVLILAAAALPLIGLACLLPILVFAVTRRWIESLISVALTLALLIPLATAALNFAGGSGIQLRIMTFNMRLGQADATELVAAVRAQRVQVLMVQELTPAAATKLRAAGLETLLGNHYSRPELGGSGIGLYSADPLTATRSYPGFSLQVISAQIVLAAGQQVTVFSSHLAAPWPQQASAWRAESAQLGTLLAGTAGAVIDAGDFNATINHKAFRNLIAAGNVVDAAHDSGALTLRSFPANHWFPPLFGIDHVLLRTAQATDLHTVRIDGSDHRAVVANLLVG